MYSLSESKETIDNASKVTIKRDGNICLEFSVQKYESSIGNGYYTRYFHEFFTRENKEDWLYLHELYPKRTRLFNLTTGKTYENNNYHLMEVKINPAGKLFASIGHLYSFHTDTVFYELLDPEIHTDFFKYIPLEGTNKDDILNAPSGDCGIEDWIDDVTIRHVTEKIFSISMDRYLTYEEEEDYRRNWKSDDDDIGYDFDRPIIIELKYINGKMCKSEA